MVFLGKIEFRTFVPVLIWCSELSWWRDSKLVYLPRSYELLLKHFIQTESSLSTLFLYMVLYPEVAKSAQAELDEFYNSYKRLPMFSDKHRLPYISCIVKEVYR